MSSSAPPSLGQWPPLRPSKRSKLLRNGSFIIPSTGERVRRSFTLRQPPNPTTAADASRDAAATMWPFLSTASAGERLRAARHNAVAGARQIMRWFDSPQGRGVLKCTLAYTLASLWTFCTPLSTLLGQLDGKHVVATITVYFHPARSFGSMVEAVLVAIVAVGYAELVSVLSMCVSVLVGGVLGCTALAYALVLLVFIGGGFGFIGWVKQRMNNPLVNVGSTLASLAIIGVVTKETAVFTSVFSNQKLMQIFKMLIFGISTTTAVNLLVWRVSAVALLRESLTKASTSLASMLAMVTTSFLSGSEDVLTSPEFTAASSAYTTVHPQLVKNLRESKFERYLLGHETIYQLDRAVARSLETLAQSIGGLRSAANTQFTLLREAATGPPSSQVSPTTSFHVPNLNRSPSSMLRSGKDLSLVLSAIDEAPEENMEDRNATNSPGRIGPEGPLVAPAPPSLRSASDIFELFIALLGPSMKSLAYTLSEILREHPFGAAPDYTIQVNEQFRHSLADALALFNEARARALQELYRQLELERTRSVKAQADFEEVAAACGHFSFSLQTFGEEMRKYLDVLDDLKYADARRARSWWWAWPREWGKRRGRGPQHARLISALPYNTHERDDVAAIKPIKRTAMPRGIPDAMVERRDTYSWEAAPSTSKMLQTLSQRLLRVLRKIARDDIRFGLKTGIGATLWAMFAFIPETRDTYQHWRGEWGLLSFMIVCSMTVGASNTTGWSRFIGTLIGAGVSVVNWNLSRGNAIGLIALGWLVAFWSFWMIVARGQAPLGRITLLAYNVSTLYAYSLSQRVEDPDEDEGGVHPLIWNIATHRFIAVTAGILWGLIVCRLIWPISARRKFREGLSVLFLQMGLIWKRGPLAILLRSDCTRSYLRSGEQAALQKYAARLEALHAAATSEFELRGPFPTEPFGRVMRSTKRILDAFYAMSLVTQRRGQLTEGERALLQFTAEERALLCSRICHVFQVLASSLMLEYPLTDAAPAVSGMRDRLLGKIFLFRKEHQLRLRLHESSQAGKGPGSHGRSGSGSGVGDTTDGNSFSMSDDVAPLPPVVVEERDYALLYAYALVTGQVADELRLLQREIEGLYGVLDENLLLLQ